MAVSVFVYVRSYMDASGIALQLLMQYPLASIVEASAIIVLGYKVKQPFPCPL